MIIVTTYRTYANGIITGKHSAPSGFYTLKDAADRVTWQCRNGWTKTSPHSMTLTGKDADGDSYTNTVIYFEQVDQ